MKKFISIFSIATATVCIGIGAAWACNVPVFRYALERWEADPYEVTILYKGDLTAEQQAIVTALQQAREESAANLEVRVVDVDKIADAPGRVRELWSRQQTDAHLPWMTVEYPEADRIETPVWSGPLGVEAAGLLVDSPARREIARRLLKGESVVWALLESGDSNKDASALELLQSNLRRLEKELQLPEPDEADPVLFAPMPVRLEFGTLRLSRADPLEAMFVRMLEGSDPLVKDFSGPVVYPVFGRGRSLAGLAGEEFSSLVIAEAAAFLSGACSCEVKALNPGTDLLIAADWDALIEGRVVKDPELPPLISLSQLAAAARPLPVTAAAAAVVESGAAGEAGSGGALARNLAVVAGLGLLAIIVGSLALRTRSNG
jgi:hypothetical protein